MEQMFPRKNKGALKGGKIPSDQELLAKHYDETMAALKELCQKHKVNYDIFKRL